MKNINISGIVAMVSNIMLIGSLVSCQKFVDVERTNNQKLVETVADAQLILDNYGIMNNNYPPDSEVMADNYYLTDDTYQFIFDPAERSSYIWSPTVMRPASGYWQSPYLIVYYANVAMEAVEKLRGKGDPSELNNLQGQGLFFRANIFFQMAQLYARPYEASTADINPGIPLRLTSDINEKSDRNTVRRTYDRIITDLKLAANLLPSTIVNPSRPSKSAAYALLARVYLAMQDYPNALQNAADALSIKNELLNYNDILDSETFTRFNKEVIFHSVLRTSELLEPGDEFFNIAKIDPALINSYDMNDLRRKLFFKENFASEPGTYRFTGNYESASSSALFNGLTTDELYLVRAECYARAGNTTAAMDDLNTLLRTRWVTGTYTDMGASSPDDALIKVLTERRKELVMRGQRWTDLRRLNLDQRFAKTLERTLGTTIYSLPPNDVRYTLLIPNEVITNSDFVIFQNPR